jgi:hypothetical protein
VAAGRRHLFSGHLASGKLIPLGPTRLKRTPLGGPLGGILMKAFILGAGSSKGSLEALDVPVAAEFGEVLSRVEPGWETAFPALSAVVKHLGRGPTSWSLEDVWKCLDWYAKLQRALPMPKTWSDESRQLKKALLTIYGRRCDDAASLVRDDATIANLFRDRLQDGDVLVSFNYDTIAERVATRWVRLTTTPRGGEGAILAKPHGSTSWTLDLSKRSVTWLRADAKPLDESLTCADVDCGREPLVLGAVPIKSELMREVQEHCGVPSVFDAVVCQWRTTVEAIRDAEVLIVVGYSFPAEDVYGRFLLQEGLRLRVGKLAVEFFEVEDKACERRREIERIFEGHLASVEHRGPVRWSTKAA